MSATFLVIFFKGSCCRHADRDWPIIATMRGKIAIVVMLSLAVVAAGYAWYQNYQRSVRARAFWGDSAARIRFAHKVEAFWIELPEDPQDRTYLHPEKGGLHQYAREPVDISTAPGLLNARTAL